MLSSPYRLIAPCKKEHIIVILSKRGDNAIKHVFLKILTDHATQFLLRKIIRVSSISDTLVTYDTIG